MTQAPEYKECPYCGGDRFCEAKGNSGYAYVSRVKHPFRSSNLIHTICLQCGGVIHTRAEKLSNLLLKDEKGVGL